MNITVVREYDELSKKAAGMVVAQIVSKSNSVIGFATGSTPLGMYREIVRLNKELDISFSGVTAFNLDEYIGLPEDNENSYHCYMMENLFKHIDIKMENIHIPDGNALDIDEECRKYENEIYTAGGIDLQVLGIGKNGHIGFNEPDSYFEAATHRVKLDKGTIQANSRFFADVEDVPHYAISMGIKTIMKAKKILLLANGREKAEAIYKAVNGPITPDVPASILQVHQNVDIIIDEAANQILRWSGC